MQARLDLCHLHAVAVHCLHVPPRPFILTYCQALSLARHHLTSPCVCRCTAQLATSASSMWPATRQPAERMQHCATLRGSGRGPLCAMGKPCATTWFPCGEVACQMRPMHQPWPPSGRTCRWGLDYLRCGHAWFPWLWVCASWGASSSRHSCLWVGHNWPAGAEYKLAVRGST